MWADRHSPVTGARYPVPHPVRDELRVLRHRKYEVQKKFKVPYFLPLRHHHNLQPLGVGEKTASVTEFGRRQGSGSLQELEALGTIHQSPRLKVM